MGSLMTWWLFLVMGPLTVNTLNDIDLLITRDVDTDSVTSLDCIDATLQSTTMTVNVKCVSFDDFHQTSYETLPSASVWRLLFDAVGTRSWMTCTVLDVLQLPFITSSITHPVSCPSLQMRPSIDYFITAALEIFQRHQLPNNLMVIMDFRDGIQLNSNCYSLAHGYNFSLQVRDIQNMTNTDTMENTNVLIVGYSAMLKNVATYLKNITDKSSNHWIVTPIDSSECPMDLFSTFICLQTLSSNMNASLQKLLYLLRQFEKQGLFMDAKHNKTVNQRTFKERFEIFTTNWLMYNESSSAHITIVKHVPSTTPHNIGSWSKRRKLNLTVDVFKRPPPPVLKIVTIHEPPFVRRIVSNNITTYIGYTIDVLDIIAKRLGFNYTLYEPPDKQYGVVLPNGIWTGIIGQVAYGAADMGVGPVSVTAEREMAIDFSAPYFDYAGLQILVKDTSQQKPLFVFVSVFSESVWILWLTLLIVTSLGIYIFHRIRDRLLKIVRESGTLTFNLKDSFWFAAASLPLAGPDKMPTMTSCRLFVAGFWFFCQIIMATYTANLAAFLTASRLVAPVENLEDLASQSQFRYSVQAGTVSETYFQRMANIENNFYKLWRHMSFIEEDDPDINRFAVWDYPLGDKYMRLWDSMKKTGFVKNSEEGIQKVLEGDFAFFHETPMIKFEMSKTCGLMTVGQMFSAKPYAFVLPQGPKTPLIEKVSEAILQLQSETILTNFKEKWWENNTVDCDKEVDTSGLSFEALGGIFIVIGGGCVLSFLVLAVELLSYKQKHKGKELDVNKKTESCRTLSEYESEIEADSIEQNFSAL